MSGLPEWAGRAGGEADRMPENLTLSPKQRRAVETLTKTGNASAAAEGAGVSRETLYQWLKMPAFRAALDQAQAAALEQLQADLLRLAGQAAETLGAVMADRSAPMAQRIRAADITLAHLLRVRELVSLEQRIKLLEEQARKP